MGGDLFNYEIRAYWFHIHVLSGIPLLSYSTSCYIYYTKNLLSVNYRFDVSCKRHRIITKKNY